MAWMAKLDARAAQWSWPAWSLYQVTKWSLVALGAAAMTYHFVQTWGWPATLLILLGPAVYGLWTGWATGRGWTSPPGI